MTNVGTATRPSGMRRMLTWSVLCSFAFGAGAAIPGTVAQSARFVSAGDSRSGRRLQVASILTTNFFRALDPSERSSLTLDNIATVLDDRYTHMLNRREYDNFVADEGGHVAGIGVELETVQQQVRVTRVYAHSPAARSAMRVGDVVTSIDGEPIGRTGIRRALHLLGGTVGDMVQLGVERHHGTHRFVLERADSHQWLVQSSVLAIGGRRVGVIAPLDFSAGVAGDCRAALRALGRTKLDAIVLDLRGNPGGYATEAIRLAEIFLPPRSDVFTEPGEHLTPSGFALDRIGLRPDVDVTAMVPADGPTRQDRALAVAASVALSPSTGDRSAG